MKNSVCFVDDDKNELNRFVNYLQKDFIIGIGTNPKEALASLNEKGINRPDLWVLDMYFPEERETSDNGKREINEEWHKFLDARDSFKNVLSKYGQSAHGGLKLANEIKVNFKNSNFVFFTRKGMIDDAIRGLKSEAMQIIKKPDYNEDDLEKANGVYSIANDIAFQKKQDEISQDITNSIKKLKFWYRNKKLIIGIIVAFIVGILASISSQIIYQSIFWQ